MTALFLRFRRVTVAAMALVCLVVDRPLVAQTADDLFNGGQLQSLQITMHPRDWDSLRANFTSNDFYPADVTWNGLRVRNLGVRSRGLGSRSGIKPGLELDFAHYSSRSQFLGLKALVLDNFTTDPSMIRERVAMALLRRLGIPAPREAHAQLWVNGQYAGLYALVEPVDTVFVQRAFGDSSGALFEYHWLQPFFATFLGENLDAYRPLFEPRTQQTKSTFELFDPIRELFRTINDSPADAFRESVNRFIDLDSTLRLIAAESFLAEWDGVIGYAGMNNFYLYRDNTSGQSRMLPWDADHAMYAADYPLLAGSSENVLMRRSLEDPALRQLYASYVREAIQSASADNWLAREIAFESQQIRDSAFADPVKPYSNEEFDAAIAELTAFGQKRIPFATKQLEGLR
ncbi:MAG TPA: CotH kinase family protein [Vicinamibacterales bacterium]|jgi:spore coat protein CotH